MGGVSADVLPAALSAAVCLRLALDERSLLDGRFGHRSRRVTDGAGRVFLLDAVEERRDEVHTHTHDSCEVFNTYIESDIEPVCVL